MTIKKTGIATETAIEVVAERVSGTSGYLRDLLLMAERGNGQIIKIADLLTLAMDHPSGTSE